MKLKIGLLKDPKYNLHEEWSYSLSLHKGLIDIQEIDFVSSSWVQNVQNANCHLYILRPPGFSENYKRMIDERAYVLNKVLQKNIYPSLDEILIYENKRNCAYWLQANNVPHPQTWIFYDYEEAKTFFEKANYPLVAKLALGAGGSGVSFLKSKSEANDYLDSAFKKGGLTRSWGPNFRKGNLFNRIFKRLSNLKETYKYFKYKRAVRVGEPQKNFVIFQQYIECNHEWRCVLIGDSFFGHKKLRTWGEKISGTSAVSWDIPDERLLNFVKDVCDKGNFTSMAVDIFEDLQGNFFVNELQCYFGSKNQHQMIKDGIPGRFIKKDEGWVFQEGTFNTNNSFDLRVKYLIDKYLDK